MIPVKLDYVQMFDDLNAAGISDYKIEMICGLAVGHVSHIRSRGCARMTYEVSARVYNFWESETTAIASTDTRHALEVTTT